MQADSIGENPDFLVRNTLILFRQEKPVLKILGQDPEILIFLSPVRSAH
jgi:hypothetical protein